MFWMRQEEKDLQTMSENKATEKNWNMKTVKTTGRQLKEAE